jgi:hypothetical protein
MADTDPRQQPGAYVTDGYRLYMVLTSNDREVSVENCQTEFRVKLAPIALLAWKLVQAAPAAPDYVDQPQQEEAIPDAGT